MYTNYDIFKTLVDINSWFQHSTNDHDFPKYIWISNSNVLVRELPDVLYSNIPYDESFIPDFTALEFTNYDVEFYNPGDLNSWFLHSAIDHASPRCIWGSNSNVFERELFDV